MITNKGFYFLKEMSDKNCNICDKASFCPYGPIGEFKCPISNVKMVNDTPIPQVMSVRIEVEEGYGWEKDDKQEGFTVNFLIVFA